MSEPLLSARFLFRFAVECRYTEMAWTDQGLDLPEECRLPTLGELEGHPVLGDVRVAWSDAGMGFTATVTGKRHPSWCRENKLEDSDGLQVWIDTRDTHNIHRATRFCHRFVFLPSGGGRQYELPVVDQLLIDRARENANPVRPEKLRVASVKLPTGYKLSAFLPTMALTGFNPIDNPKLGFTYWLFDRERGEQTFSVGTEFPFPSDPSLWGTLELVR